MSFLSWASISEDSGEKASGWWEGELLGDEHQTVTFILVCSAVFQEVGLQLSSCSQRSFVRTHMQKLTGLPNESFRTGITFLLH